MIFGGYEVTEPGLLYVLGSLISVVIFMWWYWRLLGRILSRVGVIPAHQFDTVLGANGDV